MLPPRSRAAARGALLGALCGDAIGAVLEFLGRLPGPADLDAAFAARGGGAHGVAPGQITDDGELTLCLARALRGRAAYDAEAVAASYLAWMASSPFDVGGTTATAFSGRRGGAADVEAAARASLGSKANGAMMRESALGAWAWRLDEAAAADAARADARLSHPSAACQESSAAYVVAIRHLVTSPGDAAGALDAARRAARDPEVIGWIDDAARCDLPPGRPMDGFVRIAFTHAMFHLRAGTPWEPAIRGVLALGGDTDTNACIVGGLLGALHGEDALPARALAALRSCDTALGRRRPAWLSTRTIDALADELIA